MPCCGKARALQQTTSREKTRPAPSAVSGPQPPTQSTYFRYVGKTRATVTGPASSQSYRFLANGAAIAVDPRDAAALSRVPNLRLVRHP